MKQLTPQHVPLTCEDVIRSGWLRRTRNAIVADGYQIRAGADLVVEAQVINDPDSWMPIMLSNGGKHFADADQLAMVIEVLEGRVPIPELFPPA